MIIGLEKSTSWQDTCETGQAESLALAGSRWKQWTGEQPNDGAENSSLVHLGAKIWRSYGLPWQRKREEKGAEKGCGSWRGSGSAITAEAWLADPALALPRNWGCRVLCVDKSRFGVKMLRLLSSSELGMILFGLLSFSLALSLSQDR